MKINGKFISHMESKYFVLVENKNCDKEVRILNDDDIITFELNEKKGIFDDIIDQIPKVGAPCWRERLAREHKENQKHKSHSERSGFNFYNIF